MLFTEAINVPTGVSGPDAIGIVDRMFSRDISEAKSHTMHYGDFASDLSTPIDDVMAVCLCSASMKRLNMIYTIRDALMINV